MRKTDRQLGMHCNISRRDFIHGAGIAALGLSLPGLPSQAAERGGSQYPPTLTGLRGSHSTLR